MQIVYIVFPNATATLQVCNYVPLFNLFKRKEGGGNSGIGSEGDEETANETGWWGGFILFRTSTVPYLFSVSLLNFSTYFRMLLSAKQGE